MLDLDQVILGITLAATGLVIYLLTRWLLRAVLRMKPPAGKQDAPGSALIPSTAHDAVVLVIQSGGRVLYANDKAREWFNIPPQDQPNLENIARRARPKETFLSLCAAEGKARLSMLGLLVDCTSYALPLVEHGAILLTMQRPDLTSISDRSAQTSPGAISIITELSQEMTASLDLETTLQSVLANVDRLIPSDISEITLWDATQQHLIPYRYVGTSGMDRRLETTHDRYGPGEGFSGKLVQRLNPLLVPDVDAYSEARPVIDRQRYPIKSFLGMPLMIAGEAIGTLELASLATEAFSQEDLEILRLLSGQAAVAIQNAQIYEEAQRRVSELAGLANLAQAVGALRDPQDLFEHLIRSIQPLLDVEILGLLLYDESRHSLEAQVPFIGMPDQAVGIYQTKVEPGSPAEKVWLAQEVIQTSAAPQDQRLIDLGLDHLAQAAGIEHTALVPLASGGRPIGYLQAANKRDRSPLNEDDLRILAIIAGQAGAILDNASLIQESRRRTRQAEALRRIASLTGSVATIDEILKFSLQELARLLQADAAAIFTLDAPRGELRLHKASIFGIPLDAIRQIERLQADDPQFHRTVTSSRQPFLSADVHEDPRVLPLYRPLIESFGAYHAVIDVPLEVREQGMGEIILASQQPAFFNPNDVQLAASAARQIAGALERTSLYTQTDVGLRRQVEQLTAVSRISRELSTTFELEALLEYIHREALHITRAECGTILLFEANGSQPGSSVVVAHLGDNPSADLEPIEEAAIQQQEPLIVEDFGASDFTPPHDGVESGLVVPIAYQEHVVGLIHLHALRPRYFDQSAVEITKTLAVQAAIAIGNARRYQEQRQHTEALGSQVGALSRLLEISQGSPGEAPLQGSLEILAHGIQDASPYQIAVIGVLEEDNGHLRWVAGVGISPDTTAELEPQQLTWTSLECLYQPEFRLSESYFIPGDQRPELDPEVLMPRLQESDPVRAEDAWQGDDLLIVPLRNGEGNPLGLIRADAPRDGLRPDQNAIAALEIFARQAALTIESHRQVQALKTQLGSLQEEIGRSQESAATAQRQLPVLLQKDLEQTLTIHQLNQRARRMRAGLDIAEIVNYQPDRTSVLQSLGQEMLVRLNFDIALVAEASEGGPRLLHSLGEVPPESNPQALLGQRNPLRKSLESGEAILVADLEQETEWQYAPLLNTFSARSFVCLPISYNTQVDAAVLALSHRSFPGFNEEDQQSFSLLASQVAITLQNLNLLTETRRRLREVGLLLDFSRQIGSLDLTAILRTLVDSSLHAITSADAGLVATWEDELSLLLPKSAAGYSDNQRILEISFKTGEALPGEVYASGQPDRRDEVDFARDYKLSPDNLLKYREATGGRLPVSSLLVPLQAGETTLGVVVLDNFGMPGAFTDEDQALVTSLAQQTALAMENARLYQAAEQRAVQLQTLTQVAGTITSSLHPDELIATLLDQLSAILPFETGTLWIRQGEQLTVQATRGFEEVEQRLGLSVDVADSRLLSDMISSGQPIHVPNVHEDPRFPALTEHPHLSWLGIPLISKGEVVGVIALEKSEPNYYASEHIQAATTFAGQAAVALENARLYTESLRRTFELDQRSQRLDLLNRISTTLSESLDPDQILEFTAGELRQAMGASAVSALLFDEQSRVSLQAEDPRTPLELPHLLPDVTLFDHLRQTVGVFNTADVSQEEELAALADFLAGRRTRSLMALPLVTGNDLHGLFLVHSERTERFAPGEVELARTMSNQAAVAFLNARLFEETRRLTEELEQRVAERTDQLEREHRRTQVLLKIITELSASLDMDIILNRTLGLINEISGAEQSTILLVRPEESSLYYRASLGYTTPPSEGGQPTTLKPTEGLAGWVISEQQSVLVPDLLEDDRWKQSPSRDQEHRSCIAVPLMVGEEALGTLMLFHREPNHFSTDQLDLIQATAKQIAVAINNAQLFRLIADQSERLGAMLRSQQIETSRSRAILESVADGVLVTDSNGEITLFNASAEEILSMDRSQVLNKSLDAFIGLFGGAAQSWTETIRTWSDDPSTYLVGDTYSEQISLDDERVVAVNLAPVILRDEFLGTVSIFRDITHQVEVDRLKSEFVATVSHELRTPMTSIRGYVDVLLMGAAGQLSSQQTEYLQIVKNNTERLNVLVSDLLDISRIEARKVSLSLQPLDLREIADRVVDDVLRRSRDENKPMIVELHPAPNLPRVVGDPERLHQILFNLVDNAYNYTPPNGRVTVTVQPIQGEVQIRVQDTGIGIPEEEQPRVFERFYRGEDPLVIATAGTGLGLSIVKHLIEMHRGRIWVESSGVPGEGSTFSFTLPEYIAETEEGLWQKS